eukprot:m.424677 g.424677  ORF g.424677 m.424677 type:complete len:67 (+) comp48013_c0_seq1:527-727(+)
MVLTSNPADCGSSLSVVGSVEMMHASTALDELANDDLALVAETHASVLAHCVPSRQQWPSTRGRNY